MHWTKDVRENVITPGHRQIINNIIREIEQGDLAEKELLPRIPDLCALFDISDTEFFAVQFSLEDLGILEFTGNKTYKVRNVDFPKASKYMVLCSEQNLRAIRLFEAGLIALTQIITVDFYLYHNDAAQKDSLLKKYGGMYDRVFVLPIYND